MTSEKTSPWNSRDLLRASLIASGLCLSHAVTAEILSDADKRENYTATYGLLYPFVKRGYSVAQSLPDTVIVTPWVPRVGTALVREAQQHLAKLGYEPGPVDGISGKQTIAAVQEYQRDNGIKPDGIISEGLLASLRQKSASSSSPLPTQ